MPIRPMWQPFPVCDFYSRRLHDVNSLEQIGKPVIKSYTGVYKKISSTALPLARDEMYTRTRTHAPLSRRCFCLCLELAARFAPCINDAPPVDVN